MGGLNDTAEAIAAEMKAALGPKLMGCEVRSEKRVYAEVAPKDFPAAAMFLWGDKRCRFNIASGVQTPLGFEVLYHFAWNEGDETGLGGRKGIEVSVRVRTTEKEKPVLVSVADKIKAFDFIERELHDLLGISFKGRKDHKPLLTAEDWPKDFYPLRRTEERAELDYEGADGSK